MTKPNTININLDVDPYYDINYMTQTIEYKGFTFRKVYNARVSKYYIAIICSVEISLYYNDVLCEWRVGFKDYTGKDGIFIRPASEPIFTQGYSQASLKDMLDQFFDYIFSGIALDKAIEYRKVCDDNIALLSKFKDLADVKDILE